jgi:putative CocE/NonD family hydrolase
MEPAAGGAGAASGSYTAPAAKPKKTIRYYVMGAKEWRVTETWPPDGVTESYWWVGDKQSLVPDFDEKLPRMNDLSLKYSADTLASTGPNNRWHTEIGGSDVDYGDRAEGDKKLVCCTSAPLASDLELAGTPSLSLKVSTTARDGALFAYLEAVSPDGKVICLTEGSLRLLHRKERISFEQLPYYLSEARRTFRRADATPVTPQQEMEFSMRLLPVAARIPKGWCVRIAIAAHDADTFAHYPPLPEAPVADAPKSTSPEWVFRLPRCMLSLPTMKLATATDARSAPKAPDAPASK